MIVSKKLNAANRLLAFVFFLFVSSFGAITWYMTQPDGTEYFFAWYYLWGVGFPFLAYAAVGTRAGFWAGQILTFVLLMAMNLWGHQVESAVPNVSAVPSLLDWTYLAAGLVGQFFAWIIFVIHDRARMPHRGARVDGGDPRIDGSIPPNKMAEFTHPTHIEKH